MSIGRKFALWTVSILLAISTVTAYVFYAIELRNETARINLFGRMAGRIIEESLITFMQSRDNPGLNKKLDDVKKNAETISGILLLNTDGVVKAATDKELINKKFGIHDAGCRECHEKGDKGLPVNEGSAYRWASPIENKPACHACHLPSVKNNGVLIIDFSVVEFKQHVREELRKGFVIFGSSIVLMGIIMVLLSRALVTRRLERMGAAMKDFQQGGTAEFTSVDGHDEITKLEKGFNDLAHAITTREREKDELVRTVNEQLRFLQVLIDTIPMPVFYKDVNGIYQGCNKAFEAFLGLSKEKLIGKSIHDIASKELADKYFEMDKALFDNPGIQVYEYSVTHADGSIHEVIFNKATYTDAEGKVAGLLGTMLDITDRKKAEEEIRRNFETQNVINSLLQVSLQNVPLEGILGQALNTVLSIPWLTLESRGGIFLVEDASDTLQMKAQKGLSPYLLEECGSIPLGKCLCGRAASIKELQFADTLDERHEIRYDGISPHGHYCLPILFSDKVLGVISLYLSEGHKKSEGEVSFLKAIANVLAGIIQRKRVEDEKEALISDLQLTLGKVSHSQRMWQETFDSIGDMMSIHDSDFNIIKVNRAFASYFGLSPKEVINKKCYEFFHSEGAPAVNCPHMTTMRDGFPATVEYQDSRTKKIFLISTFPFYFHDANFHGSIHIAKDITEEREKEMRLIMSERLAALGQMASGIAHEINNPLAAIAGCSEGLLARVRSGKYDPVLFENYLRIIEEEIMRCKGITTDMLSFVRKSTYERRAVSLNEITDKTIELIGFQGRLHNIELVMSYAADMPTVEGNEGELRQVILIIIMNALDAMGDSGKLQVQTGTEGRTAFIKVTDSGVGIPQENLSKIFGPFFTTKSDRGGTGLGLSIANEIVVNHNGVMHVESEEGRGSTFKITLPLKTL